MASEPAWVTEDSRLYWLSDEPKDEVERSFLKAQLNRTLDIYGLGFYFTGAQFRALDVQTQWVDPVSLWSKGQWGEDAVSDVEQPGFEPVHYVNLEALPEGAVTYHVG